MKLFSKLAGLLSSVFKARPQPASGPTVIQWSGPTRQVRTEDLAARSRRQRRTAWTKRGKAMCPSCRKPLRRRLAGGLGRTDRYFDKQMACMVCTPCAPARV